MPRIGFAILILVAIGGTVIFLAVRQPSDNEPADTLTESSASPPADNDEPATIQPSASSIPDLTLSTYDGSPVQLATAYAGSPLVLNSWASWCPFCVKELPDFAQVQAEYGDAVTIVAINRQESLNTSRGYTDRLGVTDDLVFLLDPSDSFYRSIGAFSMPETTFYDAAGTQVAHQRGPISLTQMRELINQIL